MSSEKNPEQAKEEDLAEGTLLSHLTELRSRLLKMVAAVLVVFACLLPFAKTIFEAVSGPLSEVLPGQQLIATNTIAPLLVPFKLAFFMALFIAMPVILYQFWAFIADHAEAKGDKKMFKRALGAFEDSPAGKNSRYRRFQKDLEKRLKRL